MLYVTIQAKWNNPSKQSQHKSIPQSIIKGLMDLSNLYFTGSKNILRKQWLTIQMH